MPTPLARAPQSAPLPLPASRSGPGPATSCVAPLGQDQVAWAESPARLLHERLVATFAAPAPAPVDQTLSPRAKLAILVGSSAALWLLIGLAVAAIA